MSELKPRLRIRWSSSLCQLATVPGCRKLRSTRTMSWPGLVNHRCASGNGRVGTFIVIRKYLGSPSNEIDSKRCGSPWNDILVETINHFYLSQFAIPLSPFVFLGKRKLPVVSFFLEFASFIRNIYDSASLPPISVALFNRTIFYLKA